MIRYYVCVESSKALYNRKEEDEQENKWIVSLLLKWSKRKSYTAANSVN